MHWSPRRARGLSRLQARAIRSAAAIALVFLPLALVSGPGFNAEATPSGARSLLASFTVSSNGIDANALNLGVRMTATQAVTITRSRFYQLAESNGTHTAHVWAANGSLIATEAFTGETASGWQEVTLSSPVAIASGAEFTVGYFTSAGHYPRGSFDVPTGSPFSGVNGAYEYSAVDGTYPPNNQGTNYGIDFDYTGGVPDPPTSVSAVAGDASATVDWAAPASDGGSAVTGYTVASTPAGAVCAVTGAMRFPRKSRHPLFASALGARWKDVEHVKSKEVHDRVQGRGRASGDRFGSVDRGGRPGAERGRAVAGRMGP